MAKKKRNNRLIFILVGAAAILMAVAYMNGKKKPKGEKVTTEKVEKRTIKETVSASGKVFPEVEVKISSDVSGEIVELLVEEGDSVVSGQLLAKIDPDAYQSQVERGMAGLNNSKANLANQKAGVQRSMAGVTQSKAQREQIEAQLANTKAIHERNVKLHKDGVVSDADFELSLSNLKALEANIRSAIAAEKTAEANLESAKQSVKAAEFTIKSSEATLKELRTSLRRTTLYAPTNGIVSQLNVEQGERVVGTIQMTGTEMMRIANLNAMEVQVDVSENDVLRVSLGDDVEIEVDAYLDRTFKGKVSEIASSASNAGGTASLTSDQVTNFIVKIRIEPESYQDIIAQGKRYPFRPGMSASVDINTETKNEVVSVPIQAVTTREPDKKDKDESGDDLLEVVFLASADTVKMVEVKTGVQDDTYIEVLSGLSGDEEIVVGPYTAVSRKLEQGKKIQVEKKDKKKNDDEATASS